MNQEKRPSLPFYLLAALCLPFLIGLILISLPYLPPRHAESVGVKHAIAVSDPNAHYLVGK
jgi:hypothetical protein